MALLWLTRQPDFTSFTTIYIDDVIFLNHASFESVGILAPHYGYLNTLPRSTAAFAAAMPQAYAPIVISVATAFVTFAGMVAILGSRNQHIRC